MLVKDLLESFTPPEFKPSTSLSFDQRCAWINPQGQIYNLGGYGHSYIANKKYTGFDSGYDSPQEQAVKVELGGEEYQLEDNNERVLLPLYQAGWVALTMRRGVGIRGTAKGINEAWIYTIAKYFKNFQGNVYVDVFSNNYKKPDMSVEYQLPNQRRELTQFIVEKLDT
jgi:hypothetical protein